MRQSEGEIVNIQRKEKKRKEKRGKQQVNRIKLEPIFEPTRAYWKATHTLAAQWQHPFCPCSQAAHIHDLLPEQKHFIAQRRLAPVQPNGSKTEATGMDNKPSSLYIHQLTVVLLKNGF